MKVKILPYILLGMVPFEMAFSASYDTLPKNISTFAFKQVMVSDIKSEYDAAGKEEALSLKEEFTSNRLQDVSSVIKSYFEQLQSLSPAAYDSFSLGEFSADVNAEVSAQGFGYGYGLTDRLTVYGSLPVYHITTDVNFQQTKPSNVAAIRGMVAGTNPDTAIGKFVKDLTMQLPSTNTELLQSMVVNYYGYKPIGKWEKDALGDAELGFIYRLTDFSDRGIALSSGVVLPTGSKDDPDSLQDVATGDGQYDTFLEVDSGISFDGNKYQLDFKNRYTYQFASNKEVRWYNDPDLPLSDTKKTVNEKLGNKFESTLTATYNHNFWLSFNSSLILNFTEKTTYNIEDPAYKNALEHETSSQSTWLRLGSSISTIEAYKRKKFDMPFDVALAFQRLLNAKNTASYNRIDLDLRFYF